MQTAQDIQALDYFLKVSTELLKDEDLKHNEAVQERAQAIATKTLDLIKGCLVESSAKQSGIVL